MARAYVTRDGEALDLVCHRELGGRAGVVERVLEANPHVAAVAHAMPAGLEIALPDGPHGGTTPALRLWD
jgi:phage tail protein X